MAEEGAVEEQAVEAEVAETEVVEPIWSDAYGESATDEIKNFGSHEAVAKGYTDLKSKLGDNIKKPDFTSEEGVQAYKDSIGIESIDQYEMPELSEELTVDTDFLKDIAFRKGIPPSVASDIATEIAEREIAANARQAEEDTNFRGDLEKQLGLKYGAKKDELLSQANKAIDAFNIPKESKEYIKENFGQDPRAIDMLVEIGKKISESSLGDLKITKQTMAPEDAKAKIAEIRADADSDFNSDNYNKRGPAIKAMEELYRIAGSK